LAQSATVAASRLTVRSSLPTMRLSQIAGK
jgi:hypothetical protein